jgi:CxxC motif-containing protein (DUF1111 family)
LLFAALAGCGPASVEPPWARDIFAPLGEVAPFATAAQRARFERGKAVFLRQTFAPEGLGPGYSASSCGGCHQRPVPGGTAGRYRNAFVRAGGDATFRQAFDPQFEVGAQVLALTPAGVTALARASLPFFGVGLLDEIPAEEIAARADPHDLDGDGVRGRVNFERGFVGKFGRKAQLSSLQGFVRLALLDHLGLTTRPVAASDLPGPPTAPVELATGDLDDIADPELPEDDLDDLLAFVALLGAPEPAPADASADEGLAHFTDFGCAACHVPALRGPRGLIPAYTDLLLHDLGEALHDGLSVGSATGRDLRTRPLWGVAAGGPYLHDGRADTLDEAIRWHGGEAQPSRDRYALAAPAERAAVLAFLASLGGADHAPDALLPRDAGVLPAGTLGGPAETLAGGALEAFRRGRAVFDRELGFGAGLGPVFNGDSCRGCHGLPVIGGAGPLDVDVVRHAGGVAHRHQADAARPAPPPGVALFERRNAPALFGLGRLDAVDPAAILALADPEDLDADGIRGRARTFPDGKVGRFGWKAQHASLQDFTREALTAELGITVPGGPGDGDGVADPELDAAGLADLLAYLGALAPPPRRPGPELGERAFEAFGCGRCHVPSLPDTAGGSVPLFSDLLLHEVAAPDEVLLDDPGGGRAFRTPPLWGVAASAPYWHDGRAATLEEAIRAHAGEAMASRERFAGASVAERSALLAFLESL